jgi:signal transduction histidine kinase
MKLGDFIGLNMDVLLTDWVAQARRLGMAASLAQDFNAEDSARQLLEQIARDMAQPQSDAERDAKGIGQRPDNAPGVTLVAREHADDRLTQGFSLNDLVAEYRALRASVARRWRAQATTDVAVRLDELVRFDEALDQALIESVARYSAELTRTRDLFVGILAHDLRTPLGAISMSAQYLLRQEDLPAASLRVAVNVQRSGTRMQRIIEYLLDFTRTRLGGALPINPAPANLGNVCRQAISEIEALHPDVVVRWDSEGTLSGTWDSGRLGQLLTNLLENAVGHGRPGGVITVATQGTNGTVRLSVANEGEPVPVAAQATIFDPLTRGSRVGPLRAGAGLGLGLFIARQIALAHGGAIAVTSDGGGTTFTVTLPRTLSPPA